MDLLLLGSLALVILALLRPIDHDEEQYLGASLLVARGLRAYVDFIYLQTPLQPWMTAPVFRLAGGQALIAARLLSGCLGTVALALTWAAARLGGADRARATLALALMGCCQTFLFCATVFRNDVLPACFLSAAVCLLIAVAGPDCDRGVACFRAALAGLLLALAVSTKLTYIPPLAAGAIWLLLADHPSRWRNAAAFAGGATIGLLPIAAVWRSASTSFYYDVVDFGLNAPVAWYAGTSLSWRLTLGGKVLDCLLILAAGPALPVLLVVLRAWRLELPCGCGIIGARWTGGPRDNGSTPRRVAALLDLMIVAGLVAALLPTPTWRQYLLPLLVPLFVRLALLPPADWPHRRWGQIVLVAFAAAGLLPTLAGVLPEARRWRSPVVDRTLNARAIALALGRDPVRAGVATFSTSAMIGSNRPLDPRFASGVFFFRTGDAVPPARQRALHGLSPVTLPRQLERSPPMAILTGYDTPPHYGRPTPDDALVRFAVAHRYRPVRMPDATGTLFVFSPR